jgi:uncharacterized membrane protein YeaQ/YmgE (transglycosylase-associated protein family)
MPMTNISLVPSATPDAVSQPSTKPSMTVQNILSIIIVVSFVGLIFVWIFFPPKGDSSTYSMLNILIGFLGAAFGTVVQYHLGSSKGSDDKNDTIKQLATGTGTGSGIAP